MAGMADEQAIRDAFRWQAGFATRSDSPLTARVCAVLADLLDRESLLGRGVLDWPGEPIADALPLRVAGGFHALARSGRAPDLAQVYAGQVTASDEVAHVLRAAIAVHDAELAGWLAGPPQTNEVGRSAVLMAGLLVLAARFGPQVELLEIGSSAGLNLLMARYAFRLGGVAVGGEDAALRFEPEWHGPPPPAADVRIAGARGVDVAPVDVADPAQAERLTAYVWPDQPARLQRIEAAIALARAHPPHLEQGDAGAWLEARLAEPQPAGTTRVLMHSVVWQYLSPATQARVEAAMARAGEAADAERPLGWLAYEGERSLNQHALMLRAWPGGGVPERLATAHAHGAWIRWRRPRPGSSPKPLVVPAQAGTPLVLHAQG